MVSSEKPNGKLKASYARMSMSDYSVAHHVWWWWWDDDASVKMIS